MINETSDAFDLRALPKATFEILNELFSIGILTEFSELLGLPTSLQLAK